MNTLNRLEDLSSRLDHLEAAAEWIAREMVHTDNGISQTATLISVLSDEIRNMLCALVQDLERGAAKDELN